MMENQMNPKEEYFQVQQEIKSGNVELAEKWAKGGFKELRERANSYVEPSLEIPEEQFVTPVLPEENTVIEETVAENQPRQETGTATASITPNEETSDDSFDPLAHEREVFDGEIQKYEMELSQYRELQKQKDEELEKSKALQEQLLKELEEARKAKDQDDEDDFFGVSEIDKPREEVDTTRVNTENVDNSSIDELRAELEALKNQQQQKDYWDKINTGYNSFWSSDVGKEFAPDGNRENQLVEFNSFYSDLAENINDRDAIRLMYDIRKNGINEFYKEKLDNVGLVLPNNFEKLYDSMEIAQFADGMQIDPKMGKLVPTGRGNFSSFEDAYFILNKDKIVKEAREKSYSEMQQKLREKQDAAVQISPTQYAPVATDMQKLMSPEYRQSVIKQAVNAGYDGSNMKSIKDPVARKELQELHANIKKYRQQ